MSRSHRVAFTLVPLIAGAFSVASVGQVYRCAEDGKTVYRDRPCAIGPKGVEIAVPSVAPEDSARAKLQYEANMGRLVVGQSPQQVETAWGVPKKKNIDTGSFGRSEQWVYDRPDGASYVYFRNGVMSSFSEHQEAPGSTPSPVPVPVAARSTRAELEAQDRAEKAGERKFIRKRAHQAGVVARIGVPESKTFLGTTECWYYSATPRDAQTNTKICFDSSGFVFDVERLVAR